MEIVIEDCQEVWDILDSRQSLTLDCRRDDYALRVDFGEAGRIEKTAESLDLSWCDDIRVWVSSSAGRGNYMTFGLGQNSYDELLWRLVSLDDGWCQYRLNLRNVAIDYKSEVKYISLGCERESTVNLGEILGIRQNIVADAVEAAIRYLVPGWNRINGGVIQLGLSFDSVSGVSRQVPIVFGPPALMASRRKTLLELYGGQLYPIVSIQTLSLREDAGGVPDQPVSRLDGYDRVNVGRDGQDTLVTLQLDIWGEDPTGRLEIDTIHSWILQKLRYRSFVRISGQDRRFWVEDAGSLGMVIDEKLHRWTMRMVVGTATADEAPVLVPCVSKVTVDFDNLNGEDLDDKVYS